MFAEEKHSSRSERYTYIPTAYLLERMAAEGFRPFAVMQGGSRDEEKRAFTKHLIRFRHESQQLANVGDSTPEIVMINSHDGTSSYQLMAGIFRLVCANGLVVADSLVENVRVPHKGDIVTNVIDGCITLLDTLPQTTEAVHVMQVPVISTAHITAADGARLAKNDPLDSLAEILNGSGHIITWDEVKPGHIDGPQDFENDFPRDLFSDDFRAVVCTFARLGYHYLRIDADGQTIEGLPVFEW